MRNKKKKDSIVETIVKYSSSNIYQQFLGVISAFIKPKLLTPELYGLWTFLYIIVDYSEYADAGTRLSMRYRIPYHESRKEQKKSREIEGSTFYGSLCIYFIVIAGIIVASFHNNLSPATRIGLLAIALIVFLKWYFWHYMDLLQAYQNFKLITSINYLFTTILTLSGIILIYVFSIYGLYISVIVSSFLIIVYFRAKYTLQPHSKFQLPIFVKLVKIGFPIMVFEFASTLIITSDRFLISYYLGIEQLGYYGIALMVFQAVLQIPITAREVVEPKLMENLNNGAKEIILNNFFFNSLLNTAYFFPFLIGSVVIVIPVLIPLILPRYLQGILPAQIVVLGSYFLAMAFVTRGIIVAYGWQLIASIIMIIVLVVNISLSIFFIKLGLGLNGVAFGSSISYFLLFFILLFFLRIRCNYAQHNWNTTINGLCWPLPIMCASITILQLVSTNLFKNDYITVVFNLLTFYVIMYILMFFAQKRLILLKKIEIVKIVKIILGKFRK